MKVTHYMMVSAGHPDDLNPQIARMVDEGWEPYGSPLCPTGGPFAQAMVKPVVKLPKVLEDEDQPVLKSYYAKGVRRRADGSRQMD